MVKKESIKDYRRVNINFYPEVPKLINIKDKTKVNIRYCLIEPFAYVHIYWDPKIYELVYDVEEPVLNNQEKIYRDEMLVAMRDIIDFENIIKKNNETILDYIHKRFKILAIELGMDLSYDSFAKIYYYLCRDFIGFNEVEPLLRDYFVEDIECNGIESHIYIVHRVYRNIKTSVKFSDI